MVLRLEPARISDHWGLSAPFWVAAGLTAVTAAVFALLARNARAPASGPRPGMFAAPGVFRTSGRAWALTPFYFLAFGGFASATGGYALGFVLMALVAVACLAVQRALAP